MSTKHGATVICARCGVDYDPTRSADVRAHQQCPNPPKHEPFIYDPTCPCVACKNIKERAK